MMKLTLQSTFKNTTKDNSEAQDAINLIERGLYEVHVDDQVYKIIEVNQVNKGFVTKFNIKKSPAQGWFDLAKDFILYIRNIVYLVRDFPPQLLPQFLR